MRLRPSLRLRVRTAFSSLIMSGVRVAFHAARMSGYARRCSSLRSCRAALSSAERAWYSGVASLTRSETEASFSPSASERFLSCERGEGERQRAARSHDAHTERARWQTHGDKVGEEDAPSVLGRLGRVQGRGGARLLDLDGRRLLLLELELALLVLDCERGGRKESVWARRRGERRRGRRCALLSAAAFARSLSRLSFARSLSRLSLSFSF